MSLIEANTDKQDVAKPGNPITLAKVQKVAIAGVLVLVGGFFTNKLIQKIRRDQALKRADTPEVQQAIKLRSAMNPSGLSWLRAVDTTDEKAIYEVAKEITNLKRVIKEYKNIYKRALMDDLQKELTPGEFSKFTLIVKSKYQDVDAPKKDIEKSVKNQGSYVLTTDKCRFYKTVNSYLVPFGGYFHTAKPNQCIGVVAKEESIRTYNVYSIYPVTLVRVYVKTIQGKAKYFYVDEDDVKLVSKEEYYSKYKSSYPYYRYSDKIFD